MVDDETLNALQARAEAEGRACVVGGLVANSRGQIFVQKRSTGRALFPGAWDIAGGHVDPGESLPAALGREIYEETGWRLKRIAAIVDVFDWEHPDGGRREFDFLVEVDGNLDRPQIEADRFSAWRWIGLEDLDVLAENRARDDRVIRELVRRALVGLRMERPIAERSEGLQPSAHRN